VLTLVSVLLFGAFFHGLPDSRVHGVGRLA
jgi:hypothetical protein